MLTLLPVFKPSSWPLSSFNSFHSAQAPSGLECVEACKECKLNGGSGHHGWSGLARSTMLDDLTSSFSTSTWMMYLKWWWWWWGPRDRTLSSVGIIFDADARLLSRNKLVFVKLMVDTHTPFNRRQNACCTLVGRCWSLFTRKSCYYFFMILLP